MIDKIDELAQASLAHDFRKMYADIGAEGMTQVLYELILSANICAQVIAEEVQRENENGKK